MCNITEKIKIKIDFIKRENLWDPRTSMHERARVGARNATIIGQILISPYVVLSFTNKEETNSSSTQFPFYIYSRGSPEEDFPRPL